MESVTSFVYFFRLDQRRSLNHLFARRSNDLLMSHMGQKAALTVRYLGIEVDDALAIAEQVDV